LKGGYSSRLLIEGALLTSVSILLFLGIQLPAFGIVSGLLCPLSLVILTYRHRWQETAGTLILAALLISFLTGNFFFGITFFLQFGLLGLVLGEMLRKDFTYSKILIVGAGFSLLAITLSLFTLFLSGNLPFFNQATFEKITNSTVKQFESFYFRSGEIDAIQLKGLEERIRSLILFLVPSFLAFSALLGVSLNYWIARAVLVRLGYPLPKVMPFSYWRVPETLVWGLIGGALLLLLLHSYRFLLIVGINLTYFFSFIYLIQGVAIVSYLTRRLRFPWYFKLLGLLFLGFQFSFVFLAIIILGIFDTWFDFRKIKQLSGSYPDLKEG
jgi:hypothetical protein